MGNPIETETKFPIDSWQAWENALDREGALLLKARHFERNTLFDDDAGSLMSRGTTLRLRAVPDGGYLTVKGAPRHHGPIKEREEIESWVGDPKACEQIILKLGFSPKFQYEKYRAIYRLDDVTITLDEVPIGLYLEIEGSSESIAAAASRLGLDLHTATPLSYVRLYILAREHDPSLPEFMVFSQKPEEKHGSGEVR
jgi:Adenylate cyclase, class 2 (thermophilic)